MKRTFIFRAVLATMVILGLSSALVVAQSPPEVGSSLPDIALSTPQDPEHRSYLGLTGEGSFKIPDIKAKVVIIEIFSMYCPHCQREAPEVNAFFQLLEKDPKLKDSVKLIGIGIGNSVFEVNVFRKKYKIPFPLFADARFSIYKVLGQVRTPYFIGVTINAAGGHGVFYSKPGAFGKAQDFLQLMIKLSGLR